VKLKLIVSILFLSTKQLVLCQTIIDKCFESVAICKNYHTYEATELYTSDNIHSEYTVLVAWNGERWLADSINNNCSFCFINDWKDNQNVKAYFIGTSLQDSWKYLPINPYFVGLRLDKPLEKDKKVTLTFTYSGVQLTDSIFRHLYLNDVYHFFAPTIYVNTEPKLLNGNKIVAKKIGTLKAVNGEEWVTETLTFTVTDSLIGNNWVLITPHNKSSRGFITTCSDYSYTEKVTETELKTIKTINIEGFDINSYKLTNLQKTKLDTFIQQITNNKNDNLQIDGFCDSSGNEKYNLWLSNQRVLEVKNYLQEKGVKNKINYKGQGILKGVTDKEKAKNRKVVISW